MLDQQMNKCETQRHSLAVKCPPKAAVLKVCFLVCFLVGGTVGKQLGLEGANHIHELIH